MAAMTKKRSEEQSIGNDDGVAKISFYTSDYIGTYHIDVQGITSKGQPISQTMTFSVE